jgi:hypothetical protein
MTSVLIDDSAFTPELFNVYVNMKYYENILRSNNNPLYPVLQSPTIPLCEIIVQKLSAENINPVYQWPAAKKRVPNLYKEAQIEVKNITPSSGSNVNPGFALPPAGGGGGGGGGGDSSGSDINIDDIIPPPPPDDDDEPPPSADEVLDAVDESNLPPEDKNKINKEVIQIGNNLDQINETLNEVENDNILNPQLKRKYMLDLMKEKQKAEYALSNFRNIAQQYTNRFSSYTDSGTSNLLNPQYQHFIKDTYFDDDIYGGERGYKYKAGVPYNPLNLENLTYNINNLQYNPDNYERKKIYKDIQSTPISTAYGNIDYFKNVPKLKQYTSVNPRIKQTTNKAKFRPSNEYENILGLGRYEAGKSVRRIPKEDFAAIKARNRKIWEAQDLKGMPKSQIEFLARNLLNTRAVEKNYDENGINLLANLIAIRQHSITLKPELASLETAEQWLRRMTKKYPQIYSDWTIEYGDYDDDPNTPDTIIVRDGEGRIMFVDGYHLGSGQKDKHRKMIYSMYPNPADRKAFYSNETESKLRSLVYKWFDLTQKDRDQFNNDFAAFARMYIAKHDKFMNITEYKQIQKHVSGVLRAYDAKSTIDQRYSKLYLSCISKVSSFYNELYKANKLNLDNFLSNESSQKEILYVFAIMYENARMRNEYQEMSKELPLRGLEGLVGTNYKYKFFYFLNFLLNLLICKNIKKLF